MSHSFLILENDPSVYDALINIITRNQLGGIVCKIEKGQNTLEELRFWQPEIVFINYAFPEEDSLQIVSKSVKSGLPIRFIMICQMKNHEIANKAYSSGVDFLISKPINECEIVHLIQTIQHLNELEQTVSGIRKILHPCPAPSSASESLSPAQDITEHEMNKALNRILSDIGIIGMTGTRELKNIVLEIHTYRLTHANKPYHLRDMYRSVCEKMYGTDNLAVQQKNMEQRIRRAIQHAFSHLAELGAEDYYDPIFTEYASLLFDFSQIRQEMRHLQNSHEYGGKINSKKFFEGILIKTEAHP